MARQIRIHKGKKSTENGGAPKGIDYGRLLQPGTPASAPDEAPVLGPPRPTWRQWAVMFLARLDDELAEEV